MIPDSKNNVYFTNFQNEHIGRVDAKTGKMTLYATPTPRSQPRRGQMDSQDRVWFGEYRGNRIGMFDTRTEHFEEWVPPTPFSAPYDVVLDKNGEAWTGSMTTDRVRRRGHSLFSGFARLVERLLLDGQPEVGFLSPLQLHGKLEFPGEVLVRRLPELGARRV